MVPVAAVAAARGAYAPGYEHAARHTSRTLQALGCARHADVQSCQPRAGALQLQHRHRGAGGQLARLAERKLVRVVNDGACSRHRCVHHHPRHRVPHASLYHCGLVVSMHACSACHTSTVGAAVTRARATRHHTVPSHDLRLRQGSRSPRIEGGTYEREVEFHPSSL